MNLIQANLLREVANEVKTKGGHLHFKAHALRNLELRTVLKESHNSPISDLVFNTLDRQHYNLFASVGSDQATIYDDEHMGDFLSVVVHYVNSPSAHHRGGELTCCAWVQMGGLTRHELGDACLAVSGPEGVIQIISVVEGRVTSLLRGHRGEVAELKGCAGVPGLLVSLGADGSLRLWDVASAACIGDLASDALAVEVHPEGRCLYTAHRGGRMCRWDLDLGGRAPRSQKRPQPQAKSHPDVGDPAHPQEPARLQAVGRPSEPVEAQATTDRGPQPDPCMDRPSGSPQPCSPQQPAGPLALRGGAPVPVQLQLHGTPLGEQLDCLRWLPLRGGSLAAKSSDGRLAVWELAAGEQLLTLRVPGTHPPAGSKGAGRCKFSVTRDGAFICVGNPAGDVYVYDTQTGSRATHYSSQKMRGPARTAALSEDGRHLLTVHGNGYILRYEYIRKPANTAAADPQQQPQQQGQQSQEGAAAPGDQAMSPTGADVVASSREVSPDPCPAEEAGRGPVEPQDGTVFGSGQDASQAVLADGRVPVDLVLKRSRDGDGGHGRLGEDRDEDGPGGKRLKAEGAAASGHVVG